MSFPKRLFLKYFSFIGGLAALPLLAGGLLVMSLHRGALEAKAKEAGLARAKSLARMIQIRWQGLEEQMSFLTNSLKDDKSTWADKQTALKTLTEASPHLGALSLVGGDGKEYVKVYHPHLEPELAAAPRLLSRESDPLFQKWKQGEGPVWALDRTAGRVRLRIYAPLATKTGRQAIEIEDVFGDVLNEFQNGANARNAFWLDEEGRPLAGAAGSMPPDVPGLRVSAGEASVVKDKDGAEWIAAQVPVRRMGGTVAVFEPMEGASGAFLRRSQAWFWTFFCLSLLWALGLSWYLSLRLHRPAERILAALADADEAGELPHMEPLGSGDEMEDFALAYNALYQKWQKKADGLQEQAMAEKLKTDAIIHSIADGLVMIDPGGLIEFINERAREFLGVKADLASLLKRPLWDFIPHTETLDVLWDLTHHLGQNKEIDFSMASRRLFLKVVAAPVRAPGRDEDLGIIITLRDVTLEKDIEQMKDDFIHSITHDLRNPMTSIRGFLKFLRDEVGGPLSEQQKKMVDTMDRASLRLLGMINGILDSAKLEAGKMELNLQKMDLRETAKHVLELMSTQAGKKKIGMALSAPDSYPDANLDPVLMERLLINLIGNAVKFTPEGGRVTVELGEEGDHLFGSVSDTGEGIPPEFLTEIFNKFKQVAGHHKGGTGLGLTICKYIVENHGGSIRAESAPGRGARFHFTLSKNLSSHGKAAERAKYTQT